MRLFNKNKIKTISKNKDYRTLVSNFGYLTLLQVAGYLFPLISIPYLARVIGAEGLGRVAFGTAVAAWFLSISTWGFNYTGTRDAARNREDNEKLSAIFSNVFWARFSLTAVGFVVLLLLIFTIPSFRDNWLVLVLSFLAIPANILFPEWFFQALERMKFITILRLLSKLLFTLSIFIFIKAPEDYYMSPLITATGDFVAGFIALYFILKRWGIKLLSPSITTVWNTINKGKDIFINNFFPNLWHSMSAVFLGTFHGSVANGVLSAGEKCQSIFQQFFGILSRTFFPFFFFFFEKHAFYAKVSISTSIFFSIILYLFAPLFIDIFYTDEFGDAVILARILAPSLCFLTISEVYGTNYLILKGYERLIRNITAYVSVFGFILAWVLVYYYSYYGAAITLVTCRGLMALLKMFYALRIKNQKI